MKKLLLFAMALCLLLGMTACAEEPDTPDDSTGSRTEYDLGTLAGWWTKPDTFSGVTAMTTFSVDPESKTVTAYDDYGNPLETYECWVDQYGFAIDAGEVFGVVTYTLKDDQLTDEDGYVHYVRCEPKEPNTIPYTPETLMGTWYKNGDTESGYLLIIDAEGYHWELDGDVSGGGALRVTEFTTTDYDISHTDWTAELDPVSGLISPNLWILEEGNILYDAFFENFYIKAGLQSSEQASLCEKYTLLRDSWYSTDNTHYLRFSFTGQVWLQLTDGVSLPASIGTWDLVEGKLRLNYKDGGSQDISLADEIHLDYCGKTFIRQPAW